MLPLQCVPRCVRGTLFHLAKYLVDSLETHQTRIALTRLLESWGVACAERDLTVAKVETREGHPLYVVIALNGTEHTLSTLVNRIAGRRQTSVGTKGVFLLRPDDVQRLVSKIAA